MFASTADGVTIDWCIERLVLRPGEGGVHRDEIFNQAAAAAPPGAGGLYEEHRELEP